MVSYRKKHVKSRVNSIKPKKSLFKRLWFWILIILLAIILIASYFILFYPKIQVNSIVASGSQKVSSKDLEDFVSKDINNIIIKIGSFGVDSKSIFLVNKNKINKDILSNFLVIEKAVITKKYPQSLNLVVMDKKPVGIFCGGNKACFYIDQNGIIFEKLSSVPSNILIVRQSDENDQVSAGETVVAQDVISDIAKIQKDLNNNFQINMEEALINDSLRLNVKTNENWQVYFDLSVDADVDSQIVKLNSLLNGGISEIGRSNLRYIDLRPKDRAIVCDNSICGK